MLESTWPRLPTAMHAQQCMHSNAWPGLDAKLPTAMHGPHARFPMHGPDTKIANA